MEKIFTTLIFLLFIICLIVHQYVNYKTIKCYFGHKYILQKSYWSNRIKMYNPIYLYDYKCSKCGNRITTHYEITQSNTQKQNQK